jgi:adenosylhomocysteine nucleosidase
MIIGIAGALQQEVGLLRRAMTVTAQRRVDGFMLWEGGFRGRQLVLARSGMGKRNAEGASGFLLDNHDLDVLISIGFGGGLKPEIATGWTGFSRALYTTADDGGLSRPVHISGRLLSRLPQGSKMFTGVTAAAVVTAPDEKHRLGAAGADVVDMESYWCGLLAERVGVPFISVRSISDGVDDVMPPLDKLMDSRCRVNVAKTVGRVATHPADIPCFYRMYRGSVAARRGLFEAVGSFLSSLPEADL